jgi:quercetin dioxygenase-like cupin family protein
LRLLCDDIAALGQGARELRAPNGTCIELAEKSSLPQIPAGRQELIVSRAADATWVSGRAGMRYRDLIPGRFGGRFIASQIQIRDGGPVPDQVHFHNVRFQMIFCVKGWVRVVYEDQGPPFVLEAGDCVLQPPRIRHRVLECSAGLEVVEISCPAEHDTFIDHDLGLPTDALRPDRDFDGQRFLRHVASAAKVHTTRSGCRDLRLAEASGGLAGAIVVHAGSAGSFVQNWNHNGEFLFVYLLEGSLEVRDHAKALLSLQSGDSLAVPAGLDWTLDSCSDDLEFLEVRLPAIER